jgi:NYN domain
VERVPSRKETDVAIDNAITTFAINRECDTIALISGDTDLAPALTDAKVRVPEIRLCCIFPFGRYNRELEQLVDVAYTVKSERYAQYQLPNTIALPNGGTLTRPATW